MKKVLILIAISLLIIGGLAYSIYYKLRLSRVANPPTENRQEIDFKSLLKPDQILFDSLTQKSPDGKFTVFVTARNNGFADSNIWVANKYGDIVKIDFQSGEFTFFGGISWSPDAKKFAYLKLYPTEIIVVNTEADFYRSKLITKQDQQDNNLLNPAIGFEGKGYIKWNLDNKIEFENNLSIPSKIYQIDPSTKEVSFKQELENSPINIARQKNDSFFSQRDPIWKSNQLGSCPKQTIGSAGCAVASAAMAFKNLGVKDIDADKLNKFLSRNDIQGYVNSCDIKWYIAGTYSKEIVFKGAYGSLNGFERLDYELSVGNQVILGFNKVPYTNIPHWVLVTKKENGKYYIADPWGVTFDKQRTLDDLGGKFDNMVVYRKPLSIEN